MSLFRCEKYLYLIHTKGFINTVNWGSARVFRLLCIINLNRKILTVTMNLRLKMMSWQFPNQPPSTTKKKSPGIALTHAVWLSMNWIMCNRDTRTAKGIWGKHLEIHLWLPQQSIPAAFPWCRHGGKPRWICTAGCGMPTPRKGAERKNREKGRSRGRLGTDRPDNGVGSPAWHDVMQTPSLRCHRCLPIHIPWTFSSWLGQTNRWSQWVQLKPSRRSERVDYHEETHERL